ncbi:MAG: threonine synthase [Planctomycetaceae bacterium]|nr:threonine synthase [Planctomycetaceae bacterium]
MSTTLTKTDAAYQLCMSPQCAATFGIDEILTTCPECGNLLDLSYNWDQVAVPSSLRDFEARWSTRTNPLDFSGVWRFRELIPFAPEDKIVTIGEGQTILQQSDRVGQFVDVNSGNLHLQYEGLNPSGSFKDNGMTGASTHARMMGAKAAACASTGNTSASLAIYASTAQLFEVVVFVGSGKIAFGKLSQALDFGAKTIQIQGDFDDAMAQVREVCGQRSIYLCNSVNPFRLEGQKSTIYRVLEGLNWEPPDWIVVPGGNLGNSSAFGKALRELKELRLIDRIPRMAVINAAGANSLYELHEERGLRWNNGDVDDALIESFYDEMDRAERRASTLATAIEINRPVSLKRCLRALAITDGVVRQVSDEQILDAKAQIGGGGFGCEPASAASVAGAKQLRAEGVIAPSDRVVCILTGHQLKDPNATVAYHSSEAGAIDAKLSDAGVDSVAFPNRPVPVENEIEKILEILD